MEQDTPKKNVPERSSYLKLLGIAGAFLLGLAILPKIARAVIMGGSPVSRVTGIRNAVGAMGNAATQETLALVEAKTAGLTYDEGNLLVASSSTFASQVQNASNTTINPATQGTLNDIQTKTATLTFTGGTELNTTGAAPALASTVAVKDNRASIINPAQLETAMLWRRIVKLVESQAAADINIMQRMTIDSFSTNVDVDVDVGVGVTGVNTPLVAIASDAGNIVTGISTPTSFNGWNNRMFVDSARDTYARGIRTRLVFS